jgi:hypothetical protein
VNAINRHKIEFRLNQVKDHSMGTVEATCRGDPGAVFMVASTRQFVYGSQGSNLVTKAMVLDRLHSFEVFSEKFISYRSDSKKMIQE